MTAATAVPLIERLQEVPRAARYQINIPNPLGMDTVSFPVGALCHEAARALLAQRDQAGGEAVAWAAVDLDGMAEAFHRVIEAHCDKDSPFHQPINADAQTALRVLRWLIPAIKSYTPNPAQQAVPVGERELLPCPFCGGAVYAAELNERYSAYAVTGCRCGASIRRSAKAELIERWNRRAALATPDPQGAEKDAEAQVVPCMRCGYETVIVPGKAIAQVTEAERNAAIAASRPGEKQG